MPEPKVISFYSFKGGAGRTVCTANFAGTYARQINATAERPILLMDMDLDSAGLTILLDQFHEYDGKLKKYSTASLTTGKLDLIVQDEREEFFAEGLSDVSDKVGAPKGTVLFVGAQLTGERDEFAGTLNSNIRNLLRWSERISTIIFDSASGRQEAAKVCHLFSDVIVCCCRLTGQFITGTDSHMRTFAPKHKKQSGQNTILLPTAVPPSGTKFEVNKKQAFDLLERLESDDVFLFEAIGEVESFKWYESVLLKHRSYEKLEADEKQAVDVIGHLAKRIKELMDQS